jgi:glyoxylase-like metal-dependent hydrolase (beta-lactamase superfamily II)/rhodanese-related sulfurtransferase
MFFKQIVVEGLGCLSYCIGCPRVRKMVVVDPKRDIQDYLDIARDEGMHVTHIFDTHIHADHISGAHELQAATDAPILIHEDAEVGYEHESLRDGQVFTLGTAKIEVLHTPGHTPNGISLLVTDTGRSAEPEMVLTGDLLFVGDIGRPDLAGEDIIEEQARNLYTSLYEKLAGLPDYLEVYPAHGQGSLCGKSLSGKMSSTLGYERRANPMLNFPDFAAFKAEVTKEFPIRPKSFSHIIETNAAGPPLLSACHIDQPLTPDQFEAEMKDGAVVIDTRDAAAFSGAHIPGSINIGFEKQLANWVGMVVVPDADILIVVNTREDYERMTTELHRIGYDRILGYLSGGISAWLMSGRPTERLDQISAHQLDNVLDNGGPIIVDVRTRGEWNAGHIEGAHHIPLQCILDGNCPDVPHDKDIVVYCGSGYRSNIAGSELQRRGYSHVRSLAGGSFAWANAGMGLT